MSQFGTQPIRPELVERGTTEKRWMLSRDKKLKSSTNKNRKQANQTWGFFYYKLDRWKAVRWPGQTTALPARLAANPRGLLKGNYNLHRRYLKMSITLYHLSIIFLNISPPLIDSFLGRCFDVMTWSVCWTDCIRTMGRWGLYVPGTASSISEQCISFGDT